MIGNLTNFVTSLPQFENVQKVTGGLKAAALAAATFFNLDKSYDTDIFYAANRASFKMSAIVFLPARLLSQGAANLLALETLRQGTSPLFWPSIHLRGTLPSHGGKATGGDAGYGYDAQNRGRCYYAHQVDLFSGPSDTHLHTNPIIAYPFAAINKIFGKHAQPGLLEGLCRKSLNALATSFLPKTYADSATKNSVGIEGLTAILYAVITPTIKFHVTQDMLKKDYEGDRSYPKGYAVSSPKGLSPLHSGIKGVIWNGVLNLDTPRRMWYHPGKVLTGVVQITAACCSAALIYRNLLPLLQNHRGAVIVGIAAAII